MKLKEPKKNRPPRTGPFSTYGVSPNFWWDDTSPCVEFLDSQYHHPAQMRSLARWLVRCANWIDEQKEKGKKNV